MKLVPLAFLAGMSWFIFEVGVTTCEDFMTDDVGISGPLVAFAFLLLPMWWCVALVFERWSIPLGASFGITLVLGILVSGLSVTGGYC